MSSFLRYKRCISEGDTVIVCRGREKIFPVKVERGKVIQVRGGAVHHNALIGKEYGSKVKTSNGKSWVFVLHPTPELWTVTLPHRTQILYSADISIITLHLGLRPGSVVVECGTGSGSFSHAIARTIAPCGHLHTFEFHEQRARIAREEFADHGLSELVTLTCRDVCKEGFGLESIADAVFLDLPVPWEAIESAKCALKETGGKLCSFSPCIEQAQRTCQKLEQCQFVDIEVLECLQRPFDVKQYSMDIPNLGFPQKEGGSTVGRKHLVTEAGTVPHVTLEGSCVSTVGGQVTEEDCHVTEEECHVTEEECHVSTAGGHLTNEDGRVNIAGGHVTEEGHVSIAEGHVSTAGSHVTEGQTTGAYKRRKLVRPTLSSIAMYTAQPCKNIPGHTGYLTFATLHTKRKLSGTSSESLPTTSSSVTNDLN